MEDSVLIQADHTNHSNRSVPGSSRDTSEGLLAVNFIVLVLLRIDVIKWHSSFNIDCCRLALVEVLAKTMLNTNYSYCYSSIWGSPLLWLICLGTFSSERFISKFLLSESSSSAATPSMEIDERRNESAVSAPVATEPVNTCTSKTDGMLYEKVLLHSDDLLVSMPLCVQFSIYILGPIIIDNYIKVKIPMISYIHNIHQLCRKSKEILYRWQWEWGQ